MKTLDHPHAGQPVLRREPLAPAARLAAILVHGRGGSPEDMLGLAAELELDDILYLVPQAFGHTWYPYSFLSPIQQNEPGITSGMRVISDLIDGLIGEGLDGERIALMGFSQGACLSLEYAARHTRRYAAVIGLSGGLIGPPGTPRNYAGSMDGTAVFIGCSNIDPHIPIERVHESAEVFRRLGAQVDERIYPGMGHMVNQDEIAAVREILGRV